MKATYHLLITLVCYLIILCYYGFSFEIILNPIMWGFMVALFALGGWHFGVGVGKFRNECKSEES
jgi:hypothetical protein